MGVKTKNRKSGSSSAAPAKETRPKGPSLHERVIDLETRLGGLEHRLGIDHAEIAADAADATQRGIEAAALSEPATTEDEEA